MNVFPLAGYYLSSHSTILGTPERPLSDLGYKGYISYWSAVILRTLAICFYDSKLDVLLPASHSLYSPAKHKQTNQTAANNTAIAGARLRKETLRIRRILLGQTLPRTEEIVNGTHRSDGGAPAGDHNGKLGGGSTLKRVFKGWAGEVPQSKPSRSASEMQKEITEEELKKSHVAYHGLAAQTPRNQGQNFLDFPIDDVDQTIYFETTMERLSLATNIRYDDLCFAMADLGLLKWTRCNEKGESSSEQIVEDVVGNKTVELGDIQMVVIHHNMVRDAIRDNKIKRPVLDVNYVLVAPAAL
jgi:hypothetical protein